MTTTDLIKLLKKNEFGANGKPREINVYKNGEQIVKKTDAFMLNSTFDWDAGAEIILEIN